MEQCGAVGDIKVSAKAFPAAPVLRRCLFDVTPYLIGGAITGPTVGISRAVCRHRRREP